MPDGRSRHTDRALIVSSDGHASAKMPEYREYLPASYHEEFDAFCRKYREVGSRNWEPKSLLRRTDPEVVAAWVDAVIDTDRVAGLFDADRRLQEMDREGLAAEVLFPDFGLPFELYSPILAAAAGYQRTPAQIDVANRAYNRWLVDFCSSAPKRFAGMAMVSFDDVDAAVDEIRWAHDVGLKGIMLPTFTNDHPLYDPIYEPIWNTVEELGMPVNSHQGISATQDYVSKPPPVPHPACALPLFVGPQTYFCHQILAHFIWGGVFERHGGLRLVLTEQGTGWVVSELADMDYSYEGSYLRRDIKEAIPTKPSEYFARQCWMGSSLFSYEEITQRHVIGLDKICLGMDYPHHEGTWGVGPGTTHYLRATIGAAHVPEPEAASMLGGNALGLWGLDREFLGAIAERIGLAFADVLAPPLEDHFPPGDVHKPLGLFA